MQIQVKENFFQLEKNKAKCISLIKQGKIVILPTDTVYGISCLASSKKSFEKIIRLKNRGQGKKFILLFQNYKNLERYIDLSPKLKTFAQNYSGAVSVLGKATSLVPKYLKSKEGFLVGRVPKKQDILEILNQLDEPIISTSANYSGSSPVALFEHLDATLLTKVDVAFFSASEKKAVPSIIAKFENNTLVKLRK